MDSHVESLGEMRSS